MPKPPALATRLLAAAALVALAGCTAGAEEQSPGSPVAGAAAPTPRTSYTADVPVLVPGAPGEPARTVAPGESGSYPDPTVYGDADVEFVRDMIVHHEQALAMAALAPERAGSEPVRVLADRIRAGQGPEIQALRGWLQGNGLATATEAGSADHGHAAAGAGATHGSGATGAHGSGAAGAHASGAHASEASRAHGEDDHAGMPGMATEADLAALAAARGADFDRRFLDLMIRHHQGALDMAGDTGARARNVLVQDVVSDVTATQSAEIDRMRGLLAAL